MDTLNPENEKNSTSLFWKNAILSFLPYKARLRTRDKLLKEVPFILMESNCHQYFFLLHIRFKNKMQLVLKYDSSFDYKREKGWNLDFIVKIRFCPSSSLRADIFQN